MLVAGTSSNLFLQFVLQKRFNFDNCQVTTHQQLLSKNVSLKMGYWSITLQWGFGEASKLIKNPWNFSNKLHFAIKTRANFCLAIDHQPKLFNINKQTQHKIALVPYKSSMSEWQCALFSLWKEKQTFNYIITATNGAIAVTTGVNLICYRIVSLLIYDTVLNTTLMHNIHNDDFLSTR